MSAVISGVCTAARTTRLASASVAGASRRSLSALSVFQSHAHDGDVVEFPRVARGLDYDLNWSLAGDRLTTRGEAYRNASIRDLLEFAPRAGHSVTKQRALVSAVTAAAKVGQFATSALPGCQAMDIEEFETRADTLRDECLSFAPRLFVEDGALGGSRAAELRVRIVTDSPVVALYFRSLLHRTPLYSPEVFPRSITLYAATLSTAAPFTAVDVDPATASGSVIAAGPVPLSALREALGLAAGHLQQLGGYRSAPGGALQSPNLAEARSDGLLDWYARDGHFYAPASEAHPDLLSLANATVVASGAGAALVLGAKGGELARAAAATGRLFAAHNVVWGPASLTSLWGGASLPVEGAASAAAAPRGALIAQGAVTSPLPSGPRETGSPAEVLIIGGAAGPVPAAEAAAAVREAAGGLTEAQAAKLAARLAKGGVSVKRVATEAAAAAALGLGAKAAAPAS